MRILQFGKYWRKDGGIETHVKSLCKGLAESNLEVVNLVSSIDNQSNQFEIDGYTVIESPTLGNIYSTSIAPAMIIDALSYHSKKPIDLIHLHFPDPMSHLASMALPAKIPRIITWHSDIIKQKHLLKLYRPFQLHAIKKAKAIIAPTQSHFTSSIQLPRDKSIDQNVIPFGFDFTWLKLTPSIIETVRNIKSQAQGRFIVFALGRHVEYKGFSVLINAMKYTEAFLVLGGEGPLTPLLKKQVSYLGLEDRIHFTGQLSKNDNAAHFHACDVFCLPSISPNEAFGIVQLEAMSCGKPVICSQLHNGVNDINPHMKTGLTVPSFDHTLLADAINKLQNNYELRELLGSNAKHHAVQDFSISKMISQHIQLYEVVASSQN
jgi:glycosyltransferase involved in cell wall biosynthesis